MRMPRRRRQAASATAERLSRSASRCRGASAVWPWTAEPHAATHSKSVAVWPEVTLHERSEVIARKTQETGCFVLLTNVPTAGEMAHTARDVLRAYKEQHRMSKTSAS